MKKYFFKTSFFLSLATTMLAAGCSKSSSGDGGGTTPPVTPPATVTADIEYWQTTGSKSSLLEKQSAILGFTTATNSNPTITVDSTQKFQTIDGFGFTLTQGSAYVLHQMSSSARTELLTELFGSGSNANGISYLRIGMGATDLSATVYSYDDMPFGQTDPTLANFSLAGDLDDVVPVLKEILVINPNIKILACPWSPPVWMKTGSTTPKGGSLNPTYYGVYATYFVKFIQAMLAEGIRIDAITPQNEPLNPDNTPSLQMLATEQANFIKNNLGPAFAAASITTKIICYDHNLDRTDYPLAVLSDAAAAAYVDGSAFHLYAGDIDAMSNVHSAFPTKNVYFTEQYTSSTGAFSGDLNWHLKNVIIGSLRNWSKVALEWNLANDPSFGPHTNGGCTECLGGLTINGNVVTRNVGYYIVSQASKFIPAGSVRIASDNMANLVSAAALRADGKKVLIVSNQGTTAQTFNIKFKERIAVTTIPGSAVVTYIW